MPKKVLKAPYQCMNVLGNKLRVDILFSLQNEPKTVQELCKELDKEQSLVSHALGELRHCHFVDFKKKGKTSTYSLKSEIFKGKTKKPLLELFNDHAKKYCVDGCD